MPAEIVTPQWMIEQGFYPTTAKRLFAQTMIGPVPPHCPHLGVCILWTGGLSGEGYGRIVIKPRGNKRTTAVHRIAWMLANGPIPEDLLVLHKCDKRTCINPKHLFLGTDADNHMDKILKGRANNIMQKLTWPEVRTIRRLRHEGWTQMALAEKFQVNQKTIWCILENLSWIEKY